MVPSSVIQANLESVRRRIAAAAERSGRAPERVRLVAVTKTVGLDEIRALHDLGVRDFGENRVLEALRRIEALKGLGARWHMIGHIQTKKANKAIGAFDLIHSLDSVRLAQALDAHAARSDTVVSALVEVNVSGEATKGGFAPGDLGPALEKMSQMNSLRVDGLMAMAPIAADPEQTRPVFAQLRALRDRFAHAAPGTELRWLSMGMSQDFEVAVEEGADLIRVGSALFREP
jgi:pyridoxal phosphate enzyme (YggS family)